VESVQTVFIAAALVLLHY